ncbi:hypothetical protein M0R45_016058 [Rubus argutus]|uniref:Uncharacterized protein n=1 Tax=Rubus argutus TaxID=59490 RepID=A0AAW1XQY3_RUBAR
MVMVMVAGGVESREHGQRLRRLWGTDGAMWRGRGGWNRCGLGRIAGGGYWRRRADFEQRTRGEKAAAIWDAHGRGLRIGLLGCCGGWAFGGAGDYDGFGGDRSGTGVRWCPKEIPICVRVWVCCGGELIGVMNWLPRSVLAGVVLSEQKKSRGGLSDAVVVQRDGRGVAVEGDGCWM